MIFIKTVLTYALILNIMCFSLSCNANISPQEHTTKRTSSNLNAHLALLAAVSAASIFTSALFLCKRCFRKNLKTISIRSNPESYADSNHASLQSIDLSQLLVDTSQPTSPVASESLQSQPTSPIVSSLNPALNAHYTQIDPISGLTAAESEDILRGNFFSSRSQSSKNSEYSLPKY